MATLNREPERYLAHGLVFTSRRYTDFVRSYGLRRQ